MLTIDVHDETEQLDMGMIEEVKKLLIHAAKEEALEKTSELSVTFVSNERIQQINAEYRNIDRPTDVISFALEDEVEGEQEVLLSDENPVLLGDIIISVEKAKEQAEEYDHSFSRELGFLAVHGFLHLLGYDHMNEKEEKVMFERQDVILESYGLNRS
ncbi:rRNA maturation RNase YbeY [Pseudalkalibacillus berkeleyi]|uniref:Endoribonuclease YbeY n=1 Tax=Pseudalkalibacillus berkeleyi TaxID=1069813 RepID=A0ABS9GZ50_9BACL|nr:rRNA maturation RNase YbeY [Pseudalkalibacillus berkeleyi]MCF6137964.1 rRNA maturation RNase YbeY [Pseudalkalibacillus berkeleyi]